MISETTSAGRNTSARSISPDRSEATEPRDAQREAGRIVRFVVIGCGSVAIDYAVFTCLSASLSADVAKAISYVAGMLFGYFGSKYWTFRSARKSASEPLAFVALYALTLLVNVGVNRATLAGLGASATLVAFFAATGTTTVLNYLGLRLLAFRKGIEQREAADDHAERIRRAA